MGRVPLVGFAHAAGVVGLTGAGADGAVRAALTSVLSTGGGGGEPPVVVATAEAMVGLFGVESPELVAWWPRIRVTGGLDPALTVVEQRLLAATRARGDAEAAEAGTPEQAPEAVGPVLLVANVPGARLRGWLQAVVDLGGSAGGVWALLLGEWPPGVTVQVAGDGATTPVAGGPVAGLPARLAVTGRVAACRQLQAAKAADASAGAPGVGPPREVAVGRPPTRPAAPAVPAVPAATVAAAAADGGEDDAGAAAAGQVSSAPDPVGREDAAAAPGASLATPVQAGPQGPQGLSGVVAGVRVLGTPVVHNSTAAGRPVRRAAVELLVYLAVHDGGASADQILEDLWPAARRGSASPRFHTAVSNLRHVLAAAAGAGRDRAGEFVPKGGGRYWLNPQLVDVDLWRLRQAWTAADQQSDATRRVQALSRVCDLYRGPVAQGCDYGWVAAAREQTRQVAVRAHTMLAESVGGQDRARAARLLRVAVALDPGAEDTCQLAMRACHRAGESAAVAELVDSLTAELELLGSRPSADTLQLARHLQQGSRRGS